jgi:hypothetical protein
MVVEGPVSKSYKLYRSVPPYTKLCDPRIHGKLGARPRRIASKLLQLGVIIVPLTGRARCGKTPQVDRRHEHYGGGHVSGIASYKSLCNRVFGTYTKRFPGPRLDPAIGLEKNFGKLYDCSRLTVHFPLFPVA